MGEVSRVRIVMVTSQFPDKAMNFRGGVESVAYDLCCSLNLDSRVELTVIRTLSEVSERSCDSSLNVIYLPYRMRWLPGFSLFFWQFIQVILELRRRSWDVVHIQDNVLMYQVLPTPKIVTVHGFVERELARGAFGVRKRLSSIILRMAYGVCRRRLKNVVAISDYTKLQLGVSRFTNFFKILNPVSDCFFSNDSNPVRGRFVVNSRLSEIKNVHTAIRAFGAYYQKQQSGELIVLGGELNCDYHRHCIELVDSFGISTCVKFLGLVPRGEVAQLLRSAWGLLHLSVEENAPVSISEALALGVPVIASKAGAIPEMIKDGVTGYLVDDPYDAPRVSHYMEDLMSDEVRMSMGESALAEGLMYRADSVAEAHVHAYLTVMNEDG
jgi:glycosyltransferase involved in cell wall biosynthesis